MPVFDLELSPAEVSDNSRIVGTHVPFYLALQVCSQAWIAAIDYTCQGLLTAADLGVVNVSADFRRELFVGPARVDVNVTRIGTSSISLAVEIVQNDQSGATVTFVVARLAAGRERSVPITPAERERLLLLQHA